MAMKPARAGCGVAVDPDSRARARLHADLTELEPKRRDKLVDRRESLIGEFSARPLWPRAELRCFERKGSVQGAPVGVEPYSVVTLEHENLESVFEAHDTSLVGHSQIMLLSMSKEHKGLPLSSLDPPSLLRDSLSCSANRRTVSG